METERKPTSRILNVFLTTFLLLALFFLSGFVAWRLTLKSTAPPASSVFPERSMVPPPAVDCNPNLWKYVHRPSRLKIIADCATVSGTVEAIEPKTDGDYHIRVKLDPRYINLLNESNIKDQNGDLVAEIICAKTSFRPDAVLACWGYTNSIAPPEVGAHVKVTGSYVFDQGHAGMEIHPLSK